MNHKHPEGVPEHIAKETCELCKCPKLHSCPERKLTQKEIYFVESKVLDFIQGSWVILDMAQFKGNSNENKAPRRTSVHYYTRNPR